MDVVIQFEYSPDIEFDMEVVKKVIQILQENQENVDNIKVQVNEDVC